MKWIRFGSTCRISRTPKFQKWDSPYYVISKISMPYPPQRQSEDEAHLDCLASYRAYLIELIETISYVTGGIQSNRMLTQTVSAKPRPSSDVSNVRSATGV